MKAGQQAATLWNSGQKVWTSARSWMKGWTGGSEASVESGNTIGLSGESRMDKEPVGLPVDAPPPPVQGVEGREHHLQEDEGAEGEPRRTSLWGPCECCISCVSISFIQDSTTELMNQLVTEYFHNENFEGVGQGQSSTANVQSELISRPPNMLEPLECQYRSRLGRKCLTKAQRSNTSRARWIDIASYTIADLVGLARRDGPEEGPM